MAKKKTEVSQDRLNNEVSTIIKNFGGGRTIDATEIEKILKKKGIKVWQQKICEAILVAYVKSPHLKIFLATGSPGGSIIVMFKRKGNQ